MSDSNSYNPEKNTPPDVADAVYCSSNCHRTKKNPAPQYPESPDTTPDQDSANSKYVTEDDKRERKDGPGGD